MILNCVCSRIKSILIAFLNVFKRALCIVNRRKPSVTDFEPLNSINVVRSQNVNKSAERDWNTWDETPRTVEEHIEQYRERLVQPPPAAEPVKEIDFFQDMTPKTFVQPTLFIPSGIKTADDRNFSRLQAETSDIRVTNEFKDWEELEFEKKGWEEVDDESTNQMIREKRKELRHQKQQQQRHQRL